MIAVTSYTWKAAHLLGTVINPGLSTTTLLGTPTHGTDGKESTQVSEKTFSNFDVKKRFCFVLRSEL